MTSDRAERERFVQLDVRSARAGDRSFVLDAACRLAAFGIPPGRTADEIVEGEARTLRAFFDAEQPAADTLLIVEAAGEPLGFVFLEEKQDYFTGARHGHIGILAVTAAAEGRGAGSALMRAAEAWARERRYPALTLNVFDANHRARRLYEHLGFRPDTVKYLKPLHPAPEA
jgi:GNAT superfamily N-acetyltransferase